MVNGRRSRGWRSVSSGRSLVVSQEEGLGVRVDGSPEEQNGKECLSRVVHPVLLSFHSLRLFSPSFSCLLFYVNTRREICSNTSREAGRDKRLEKSVAGGTGNKSHALTRSLDSKDGKRASVKRMVVVVDALLNEVRVSVSGLPM